eukprot:CAMPEP_0184644666 /NCGR_PEP_ID=MMETSP0308-20130426/1355_1 /TAXON_ID=38269 /ORGANISM="Gloeochaete witrockiana, Strain SAG 46.84" /LENGTH=198 /DNA_ID=CAMNT_0027073335 /DNA_START=63 /DNA_END=656 /DNA_ORIENTATION=+
MSFSSQRLDDLVKDARKLVWEVQSRLEVLEGNFEGSDSALQGEVAGRINELGRKVQMLDSLVQGEPASRRETMKKQVNQIADQWTTLRTALDSYIARHHRKAKETEEREALLGGKSSRTAADGSVVIDMLQKEQTSLQRSHRAIEEMFDSGRNVLTNLSLQKEKLKSAHRKMLDVMNTLGLSNTVIRMIERRQFVDRW